MQGHGGGVRTGGRGGDGGTPVSNTRGSNFACGSKVLYRGIDWLEKTAKVTVAELTEWLSWVGPAMGTECWHNGYSFLVVKAGYLHPYALRLGGGLTVYLPEIGGKSDRVRIMATSDWCAGRDVSALDGELDGILVQLLGITLEDRDVAISRVDACVDLLMTEQEAAEFFQLGWSGAAVTRGRDRSARRSGSRLTGLTVGRGDVVQRQYDKVVEASSRKARDLDHWLKRWGIEAVPEGCTVVRVEWQLRRKFLRSRGVSSVAELVAGAANVFGYLCGEWFRLAGPASGRFHKRETLSEWAAVQAAFVSGAWSGAVGGEKVPRRPSVDLAALSAQVLGVMSSMAAGISLTDDDGVVLEVRDVISYLLPKVDREKWRRVVADRMVAQWYGASV